MKYFLILLTIMVLSCSSTPVIQKPSRAPLLEAKIAKMRSSYLKVCLAPLSLRKYSEKGCAFQLLTALERSHGISFNDLQLIHKANDIFFSEIKIQLDHSLKAGDDISREIKRSFRGPLETISYLKQEYAFNKTDLKAKRE